MTQRCRWCLKLHKPRLLCDPALKILNALYARGMEGNMPTIEFPEPLPAEKLGGDALTLVRQIVVKAAVVDVADVPFGALVITGRTHHGPLPELLYPGDDDTLRRTAALVHDMAELAIRQAAHQRG